jgi:hypothetical protein
MTGTKPKESFPGACFETLWVVTLRHPFNQLLKRGKPMSQNQNSAVRRFVTGAAVAGGAAVVATGMALAGAGTAVADNEQNVVTNTGNKVSPTSTAGPTSNGASNNIFTRIGTVISNAQTQLGTAGTNAISQTGTALQNGEIQVGTAGTDAISQTGTAIQNGQVQVGTAGKNALTQLGGAGNGLLKGIGGLFNRG